MGNTLCGSVVVIAIPKCTTQDDATDSLSLRSLYIDKQKILVTVSRAAAVCSPIAEHNNINIIIIT